MKECKCRISPHVINYFDLSHDYFNSDNYDMRCPGCGIWISVDVPEYLAYGQEPRWIRLFKESLK